MRTEKSIVMQAPWDVAENIGEKASKFSGRPHHELLEEA